MPRTSGARCARRRVFAKNADPGLWCRLKDDKISNGEIASSTEIPAAVVEALLLNPRSYRSAFTLFQSSVRSEYAGAPLADQMRMMADRWKDCSVEDRLPFTTVSQQQKVEGQDLGDEWNRFQEVLKEDTAPAPVEAASRADRVDRVEASPKVKKPRSLLPAAPKPVVRHAPGDLRNLVQDIAPLRSRCVPHSPGARARSAFPHCSASSSFHF